MTIIAAYNNPQTAEQVFNNLVNAGTDRNSIGIVALKPSGDAHFENEKVTSIDKGMNEAVRTAADTTTGAATGGITGFLLGAASLALGSTALLVGGPVAVFAGSSLAANTAIGASLGGLAGFFTSMAKNGIDEAQGKQMEDVVNGGGVVLTLENPTPAQRQILVEGGPQQMSEAA